MCVQKLEGLTECNCSMCSKKGIVHLIVPKDAFSLDSPLGRSSLPTPSNTGVAQLTTSVRCGIHAFYVPRSDPDKIDVNVRLPGRHRSEGARGRALRWEKLGRIDDSRRPLALSAGSSKLVNEQPVTGDGALSEHHVVAMMGEEQELDPLAELAEHLERCPGSFLVEMNQHVVEDQGQWVTMLQVTFEACQAWRQIEVIPGGLVQPLDRNFEVVLPLGNDGPLLAADAQTSIFVLGQARVLPPRGAGPAPGAAPGSARIRGRAALQPA